MKKKIEKKEKLMGYDVHDPEEFRTMVQELKGELLKGRTVREAFDLPEEELESIYGVAYQKYSFGEYRKAADLFRYLLVLDPSRYKYILGLAASLHRLEEYDVAANHYLLASFYEPSNPIPYFHGAECFLRLGKHTMARNGLTLAIATAGDQEEYALLKERATLIKNALEEEKQ
jgi:type III secretion system low calcium response chaperone LcrH/SycD